MHLPQTVELKGIRVLTSKQLAEEYGTTTAIIKKNFSNNRKRFVDGKHYISLIGDELKAFKNQVEKIDLVDNQVTKGSLVAVDQVKKVHLVDGRTSHLYLWIEKGALLHAKSLNTDKAWEVYDYLVDFYFRSKEQQEQKMKSPVKLVVNIPENPEAQRAIQEVKKSLETIDSLIDGSNNYITEEKLMQFRRSIADAFRTFSTRTTNYLNVPVVKIEKSY